MCCHATGEIFLSKVSAFWLSVARYRSSNIESRIEW